MEKVSNQEIAKAYQERLEEEALEAYQERLKAPVLRESRYWSPLYLQGDISDLMTSEMRLSAYGEARTGQDRMLTGARLVDKMWHCYLCPQSCRSPWNLTAHVIREHAKEHDFFLEHKPEPLARCPVCG